MGQFWSHWLCCWFCVAGGIDTLNALFIRQRACAYITQNQRLLVFVHTQYPEAGIQVPGGTVEPGETPEQAVLREALEETGLSHDRLHLLSYLGKHQFDLRTIGEQGIVESHYLHLALDGQTSASWLHTETHASDGSGPLEFRFYWVSLDQVPELAGDQGELLALIR